MTPSLILFFSVALLMGLLIAMLVVLPWLRQKVTTHQEESSSVENNNLQTNNDSDSINQLLAINVATFKDRLIELQQDKHEGIINNRQYESQKTELERQLLQAQMAEKEAPYVSVKSRLILLIWIPVLTIMVYLLVGSRAPVFEIWTVKDKVGQVADDLLTGKIDVPPEWAIKDAEDSKALVTVMRSNVHHHAHDANRWMRLSELFLSMKATDEALQAMERANRLEPNNDEIATAYAKVSFFANGEVMTKKSRRVLLRLLSAQPDHEGAIMLMVMGETKAGNHDKALDWVQRLRKSIKSKSGDHSKALASLDTLTRTIENNMNQANHQITTANNEQSVVMAMVSVQTDLFSKISDTDVLFVTVREVSGGAPYAVKRLPVSSIMSQLKSEEGIIVKLTDKDAMMPSRTISTGIDGKVQLVVNARISKSGQAIAESGDLATTPVKIIERAKPIKIEINQQIP